MNFSNVRVPVIAMSYSDKHKAIEKELLVDYDTGNIYIVSATDKNVIFNVTSKIAEQLKNIDPSNMKIMIEGIGEVNLKTLLQDFKLKLDNSIELSDTDPDIQYIIRKVSIDDRSLSNKNGYVEVTGYDDAPTNTIPQKTIDGIVWKPISDLLVGQGGNSTGIDIPYSYIDGNKKNIPMIEPNNYNIFLSSGLQKSRYIPNENKMILIHLPVTVDEYSKLKWFVETNSETPLLSFRSNIIWSKQGSAILSASSYHIFEFETWDNGNTWFGNVSIFNK